MCHDSFLCCFAVTVNVAKHGLCRSAVNDVKFHVSVFFLICYLSCHFVLYFISVCFPKFLAFNHKILKRFLFTYS